ncbi:hypothetical protein MA16_Dca001272 [Dendrobium catenatum]|uniref:Uncharacterized protein n=1 Tax=Dendrobium catenatum TaxID=906689 RepID=A0A2I0WLY0_9ASPA|nr:hypothetical protein MA16_Dca001272 [Dendrobium catenatum]
MRSFYFCCFFSSGDQSLPSNFIRAVHINGHVEYFSPPATAQQVLGKRLNGYAVWTATRLLSTGPVPLHLTDRLEPGNIYFILPDAVVLHSDATPASLVVLVRRLKAMADRSTSPDSGLSQGEPYSEEEDVMGRWTVSVVQPPMWRPELETIEELCSNGRSSISSSCSREPHVNQAWDNRV